MSTWPAVPLGRLGEIFDGPFGSKLKSEHYSTSGVRVIRLQNIGNGVFQDHDRSFVPAPYALSLGARRVSAGDVLIASLGEGRFPAGRACLYPAGFPDAINKADCFCMKVRRNLIDERYLVNYLQSPYGARAVQGMTQGATRPRLNTTRLGQTLVPLPPLLDQRRIVAELEAHQSAVTNARSGLHAQRASIEALKDVVLSELFDAGRYRQVRLAEVLLHQSQGIGSDWAGFPVYGATRSGIAHAKEKVGKNGERYKSVLPTTVFYNPMRILLGSIAMLDEAGEPGITSPDYVVVNVKPGALEPLAFYEWFRGPQGQRMILDLARGAVRERILFSRLGEGLISLPPIEVQRQACRALKEANRALELIDMQHHSLGTLDQVILGEAFA